MKVFAFRIVEAGIRRADAVLSEFQKFNNKFVHINY